MPEVFDDGPLDTETAMLVAVRDRLRTELSLTNDECEIEYDELAHASVGKRYVIVIPGGLRPGELHDPNSGTMDEIVSVSVMVILRNRDVPRDRMRQMFVSTNAALNRQIARVREAIDCKVDLLAEADEWLVTAQTGQGFCEMLRWVGQDDKPRGVNPEIFSGDGTQAAGMARVIRFSGARRLRQHSWT